MRSIKTKSTVPKIADGNLYYFLFLDHVLDSEELVTCEVCGRVVSQTDNQVVISWWNIIDADYETTMANRELLTIIKSAIIKCKLIVKS